MSDELESFIRSQKEKIAEERSKLEQEGVVAKQQNVSLAIYVTINQGWGQFQNWNWNWYQFQFQFQELELNRNWIKGIGIGIGIDKEELKELIQFLFLIVNSFRFFAMFLAESLNQFDLKPFWIQLTRISLDRYIILYDLSIKWILHCSYWLHL